MAEGATSTEHPSRPLGVSDVLTINEVVRELQMRRSVVRRWLEEKRLIRVVMGRERVIWGDVLAAMREDEVRAEGKVERQTVKMKLRLTDAF